MKLFKRQDRYDLYADTGHKVASSAPNPFGKLSKQNCDEIFGVIDEAFYMNEYIKARHNQEECIGFIDGFNKAMELNKDKMFTLADIEKAFDSGYEMLDSPKKYNDVLVEITKKLLQPTEIDVEIKMEKIPDGLDESCHIQYVKVPKLDSNGCLILRKL